MDTNEYYGGLYPEEPEENEEEFNQEDYDGYLEDKMQEIESVK